MLHAMARDDEKLTKRDWKLLAGELAVGLIVALFAQCVSQVDNPSPISSGFEACRYCEVQGCDCDASIRFDVMPNDLPEAVAEGNQNQDDGGADS